MSKLIEDMSSGHIKMLNLSSLRNETLENENIILQMAKTCKIDKLIIMDETKHYLREILQNANIKEVYLYGQDGQNYEVLKHVKQRVVNDMSKRVYRSAELLNVLRNNPNLRSIKCSFYIRSSDDNYQQLMFELLLNYKIDRISNLKKEYLNREYNEVQLIVDRNNDIWNSAKKKALNFIAIRKFRCNYENLNQLEGLSRYLVELPKEIILLISKHVFTLTHQQIFLKQTLLRTKLSVL
jgi:hypothetical protein